MANNPKKVKDPTEVALSAIQEALNISDVAAENSRGSARGDVAAGNGVSPPNYNEGVFDTRPSADRPMFEPIEEPRPARRAANDDRETIGQILQAIQKGRPARSVYTIATIFAAVWLVGALLLTIAFLPSLQAAVGQSSGILVLAGLTALLFAPVLLFYFMASLSWRGQELRMIAQSMAQVAIRFSEPEGAASDSMVTVGQAIRREVAAMGDGVERALARAAELEALVHNEVAALERAYNDNELRIRGLIEDLASQREALMGQGQFGIDPDAVAAAFDDLRRGDPGSTPRHRQSSPDRGQAPAKAISTREPVAQPAATDDTTKVDRSASAGGPGQVSAAVATNIHNMQGGGAPLPTATRAFFEPRFGANFSQVRVHTDSRSADTATAIHAPMRAGP